MSTIIVLAAYAIIALLYINAALLVAGIVMLPVAVVYEWMTKE